MGRMFAAAALAAGLIAAPGFFTLAQAEGPCDGKTCPSVWLSYDAATKSKIFAFAEDYKGFMGKARTEALSVKETIRLAEAQGFKPWHEHAALSAGQKYYVVNRGRAIVLFVVGKTPMAKGFRISASHVDSPRLELKARPIIEGEGLALFKTQPHGGILNFEWGNTPLALVGHIDRKDGKRIEVEVGLKPNDPIFMIPQLAPHVDVDLRNRTQRDVLQGEELNPIIGSTPASATDGVKAEVLNYLKSTYGADYQDLVSAELYLVPAVQPRDVGFDKAMMAMNGQDDRFGAYASIRALFELKAPEKTAMVILADNEETGDNNNTGAASNFYPDLLTQLLEAQAGKSYSETLRAKAFHASVVLSTDVNDAVNPIWPSAWEGNNAPRVNQGVNLKLYGNGYNANSEITAWLRKALDENKVKWQTASYKVGKGGGGTLGREFSKMNMDVIDIGAPVLSIHHTYDLSSKADLWELYKADVAFFTAGE